MAEPVELVRRIENGERDAEAELVTRYSRGVRFLLLQKTGDATLADDLHQETFRLVLEKLRAGELREPDKLSGYLRGLAKNLAIGAFRKRAKEPAGPPADDEAFGPHSPAPGPQTRLLDKENAALVRRLMAELEPRRDREILFRYFIAEHDKEEICADFDLTSLHFNRVLHRARGRLKKLLERTREELA